MPALRGIELWRKTCAHPPCSRTSWLTKRSSLASPPLHRQVSESVLLRVENAALKHRVREMEQMQIVMTPPCTPREQHLSAATALSPTADKSPFSAPSPLTSARVSKRGILLDISWEELRVRDYEARRICASIPCCLCAACGVLLSTAAR